MLNCDILQKIQKHQIFQVVIIATAVKQWAFVNLVVTPFIVINNELFYKLLSYNMSVPLRLLGLTITKNKQKKFTRNKLWGQTLLTNKQKN